MPSQKSANAPPPRPRQWEERLSSRLFLAISPRVATQATEALQPPAALAPWEIVDVPRTSGAGVLRGTWFPTAGTARGGVLLAAPWQKWGRAYFHRRGRLEALRAAGYHSLTVDLPNFGGSGPPAGYFDRDLGDAAAHLHLRCPSLPLHLWGVSSGGYWAHPLLARTTRFSGACFEDVSPHLMEWAWRSAPRGRPFYLLFRALFRRSYRFLDARAQAGASRAVTTAYVAGDRDPGIPPEDSRELAGRAGAELLLVPGAGHLEAIKRAREATLELVLATFAAAARAVDGKRRVSR
jgi:pimeloyl-ACP methyl ester carboxylesterase